jgi:hypothetical protein
MMMYQLGTPVLLETLKIKFYVYFNNNTRTVGNTMVFPEVPTFGWPVRRADSPVHLTALDYAHTALLSSDVV